MYLVANPIGDRRQEAILRKHWRRPGVHDREGPGPVRILDAPLFKGALAKEGRLLVPGDPGDRNLDSEEVVIGRVTIDVRGRLDLR